MARSRWPCAAREEVIDTLVTAVRREPSSHLVRGAWGAGTSRVLLEVTSALRAAGAPVTHTVAEGDESLDADIDGAPPEAVLVVDDAQLLGSADARRLRSLALNGGRSLVLGARSGAPLAAPLEWLLAAGAMTTSDLRALASEEVADLLGQRLGSVVHGAAAHALARASAGRPAFLVDLTDEAVDRGLLVRRTGLWRLTGRSLPTAAVAERVSREVGRLDDALMARHELLCFAGCLPLTTATAVAGEAAVDRLTHAGYLVADNCGVRPEPPMVAEAIRAHLSPATRLEAARTLMADAAQGASVDQLVRWRLAAGEHPDGAQIEAAAQRSWAGGDPDGALELVRLVTDPSARCLEADLLDELGRHREAVTVLEKLEARGDVPDPLQWAAAERRASVLLWALGDADRALATSRTLADLDAGEPSAGLRAFHGAVTLYGGDPAGAAAIVEPFVDHPLQGVAATATLASARALLGEGPRSVRLARSACERSGHVVEPPAPVISLVLALGAAGRLAEARDVAREGYTTALDGSPSAQAWMALGRLRVALLTGELDDVDRFGLEAARLFRDLDQHATLRWATAGRLIGAAVAGQPAEASRLLVELDDLGSSGVRFLDSDIVRARAWGLSACGRPVEAQETAREAADLALASNAIGLAGLALHDLVRLGGHAADELEDLARRTTTDWARPRADHARALVDDDAGELLRAADRFEAIGAWIHAAEATASAGAAARRAGDGAAARAATGLLARRYESSPRARTPALVAVPFAPLTGREREVAQMAADGRSSRDIGASLGISVRTVDNHLQHAFEKLGVNSRHQLGDMLVPQRT